MYNENELLPISALQHMIFCERQAALIHVQQLWAENRLTIEGRQLHTKAHTGQSETVDGVRIARGLWLRSLQHGLIGAADVVEFHPQTHTTDTATFRGRNADDGPNLASASNPSADHVALPKWLNLDLISKVVPVEYKRGKPKKDDSDRVQICAQAICLEEMLNITIDSGQLFYGKRKRRVAVEFDSKLRDRTLAVARRFRELIEAAETPTATREPKCEQCSLIEWCLPDSMRWKTGASKFVDRQWATVLSMAGPQSDDFESQP